PKRPLEVAPDHQEAHRADELRHHLLRRPRYAHADRSFGQGLKPGLSSNPTGRPLAPERSAAPSRMRSGPVRSTKCEACVAGPGDFIALGPVDTQTAQIRHEFSGFCRNVRPE